MLNNQYVPDSTPMLNDIADKLQQMIDKDKPKKQQPIVIPKINDNDLILL